MKIEFHVLQNFAPSNLNRDDTGAPKDCELGGHRRARISSQCQKRAVRQLFVIEQLVPEENLGARTKRLAHEVAAALQELGVAEERALPIAMGALEATKLKRQKQAKKDAEEPYKTQYLLFVPRRIIRALAELLAAHRDELDEVLDETGALKKEGKKTKAFPKELAKEIEKLLASASDCADLALFGRMIADEPRWNVEASCQVAHAISTNTMQMDFDFYTAVDDFKADDNAGSDMMGTIQFNSSCFYRYAVLDIDALRENLDGNEDLTRATVAAFARAFVTAIPTGKQNSMAAHNPPNYVLAVRRPSGQPVSLANAFLKPARPSQAQPEKDLVDDSIEKLEDYFGRMRGWMEGAQAFSLADRDLRDIDGIERVRDVKAFFDRFTEAP